MIGRLVRAADFERVLRTAPRAKTAHFAVHHLDARPSLPAKPGHKAVATELSTGDAPSMLAAVDESYVSDRRWLGMVVPKRHAKRSVTRTLLKRQMRAAVSSAAERLAAGLWVIRLRAPFDRQLFVSAASAALRAAAHRELDDLVRRAADASVSPAA